MDSVALLHPMCFLKESSEKPLKELLKKPGAAASEDPEHERLILCRNCRHRITGINDIIEVEGRHQHDFSNPEGYIFRIGCFAAAPGCVNHGTPTLEFTWFKGFTWRFSSCASCMIHLGWQFENRGGRNFYGLILDRLTEGI